MIKVAGAQERHDISGESLERRGVIVVEPWLVPADNDDESRTDDSSRSSEGRKNENH